MALILKVPTVVQSNDATIIRFTDTTGVYDSDTNPGGWLTEGVTTPIDQPHASEVLGEDNTEAFPALVFLIAITLSNGTRITSNAIYLAKYFGPFANSNSLVFDLTPDMFILNGTTTPLGEFGSKFPDGFYEISYTFDDFLGGDYAPSNIVFHTFISGSVTVKVNQKLKEIPYSNSWLLFNHDYKEWYDILYPMYYNGLLTGMNIQADVSRKNQVLQMLGTLERLVNN